MTATRGFDPRVKSQSRCCPVCHSRQAKRLFTQQFERIRNGSLVSGYDVIVCERCGCGYADGIPQQEALDAYYRDLSKYEARPVGKTEPLEDRGRHRKVAEVILRALPSRSSRILEIGCSTGGLLALLQQAGCTRLVGLDPSPDCAQTVRSLYGIEVLTGAITDLAHSSQRFDFVILLGVLEHLRDVADSLHTVGKILDTKGLVLIDVPDATRFTEFIDAPFQQFSIEHINFFSPTSLQNLLAQNGFEVLESGQDVHAFSETSNMPSAYGIARVRAEGERPDLIRDTQTEASLQRYIIESARRERRLEGLITAIVNGREPILVWGVGTLARRLLMTSRLREANIRAFIDSNPRYHGKEINGLPILSPGQLRGRPEAVLVCSWVFGREIERQIQMDLQCPNRVIRLDG